MRFAFCWFLFTRSKHRTKKRKHDAKKHISKVFFSYGKEVKATNSAEKDDHIVVVVSHKKLKVIKIKSSKNSHRHIKKSSKESQSEIPERLSLRLIIYILANLEIKSLVTFRSSLLVASLPISKVMNTTIGLNKTRFNAIEEKLYNPANDSLFESVSASSTAVGDSSFFEKLPIIGCEVFPMCIFELFEFGHNLKRLKNYFFINIFFTSCFISLMSFFISLIPSRLWLISFSRTFPFSAVNRPPWFRHSSRLAILWVWAYWSARK